jgi:hypothetical protein
LHAYLFFLILNNVRTPANRCSLIFILLFAIFPILSLSISCSRKVSGIGGQVLDGSGKPIDNVKVIALQEKPVSGYAKFETTTGSDGRFFFRGCLPESSYKLLMHAEGTDLREVLFKTGAAGTEKLLQSPVVFRFLSSTEGIITDTKTGLQWVVDSGRTITWEQAKRYVKGLRLGGFDDWRMPNREELRTLGKIDADFPLSECCVWSSEPKDGRRAWVTDLYRSIEDVAFMSNNSYAALAVRRQR